MHRTRRFQYSSLTTVIACLAFAGATAMGAGCKASVTAGGEAATPANPPPPPAPAPPPDRDGDSIADATDACPDKPGVHSDDPAKNGCPEEKKLMLVEPKVTIVGNEVQIKEKILFDVGQSTIKPESDKLLDEIANVVKTQGKDIDLIEVGGHADKQGSEQQNLKLTDDRAKAVVNALVKRGVDAAKLRGKGYGQYCPLDPASSPEAFEKNRRVQFAILKSGGKKTTSQIGCPEAAKHGVKPQPIL